MEIGDFGSGLENRSRSTFRHGFLQILAFSNVN